MEELFIFPESGGIRWRKNNYPAGFMNDKGYMLVTVGKVQYRIHRLVYAYHTGEWPKRIDHIDQDKTNNRIDNLRSITNSDNMANNNGCWNSTGYRGVQRAGNGFKAEVVRLGKRYKTRTFSTAKEAHEEYLKIRDKVYPGLIKDN